MILDRWENAEKYFSLHEGFKPAMEYFLRAYPVAIKAGKAGIQVSTGRAEIDGKRIYMVIDRSPARTRQTARLEAHRKYIDIQIPINQPEEMGWQAISQCTKIAQPYDAGRDVEFFADTPRSWITVPPGSFVVFFPHDAHAPLVGQGEFHKAVIKVAVDW